ncbi:choline/glycine/proline betaine transport protein [Chitinophaga skermanii]|uniref:Choline/glycine/proline betaine transport protein n=1 Tax=Chitinophaga skermanii TaxID=331697 RepID=A0A327QVG2_9BACT|nr:BCCT family transporter [Chitinophaga skermanii]RAJ08599.1 choline/glycine/proline betaine transport protein [Chitinophaga skermanii]
MKIPKFVVIKPVFYTSGLIVLASLILCIAFKASVDEWFLRMQYLVTENLGWFFILTVNFILVFCLAMAFGKYGNIRLGGEKAEPEFSTGSWFAMLFSAGMGIGIMFFSVAEPVSHFAQPPQPVGSPVAAAKQAMNYTFLHWGLHAWGIYALVGLALAFFAFNKKLPLTFRSLFYPFLGERIHGWWGHAIDILSVLATLFGLSTSLGLGVQQMAAGLEFLFGWSSSIGFQCLLIIGISCIATLSVVSGLDKGVKILSNVNMILAFALMLLVFILGPTIYLLKSFIQNTGSYLGNFIEISTWNDSYRQTGWQNSWTVFYWAWWIAWSPFVGSFIARISKGRTVREFILGVLIVPAILTLLWMTIFGGTALHNILQGNDGIIHEVQSNLSTALFYFLQQFPLTQAISFLAVVLVGFFFITSSDSGSLVVDNITSGGSMHTPVLQRIFWAFMQAFIAIVLLWGGGLQALQTAVIIAGLPFAVIILLMCYSLKKGLSEEYNALQKKHKQKQEKSYRNFISDLVNDTSSSNDPQK